MRKPKYWAVKCTKENKSVLEKVLQKYFNHNDNLLESGVGLYYGKYTTNPDTDYFVGEESKLPPGTVILTIDQAEHFFIKGFDIWFEDDVVYEVNNKDEAIWMYEEGLKQGIDIWLSSNKERIWPQYHEIRARAWSSQIPFGSTPIPVSSLMPETIQKAPELDLITLIRDHFKQKHEKLNQEELEIIEKLKL